VSDVPAIVYSDGSVMWVPPVQLYIRCQDSHNDTTNCDFRSATLLTNFEEV